MKYYLQMFTNFLDFRGRSGIKEYWIAVIFNMLVTIIVEMLALPFIFDVNVFLNVSSSLASLYAVITFIPGLSLIVRRLHDTGHSGWFLLISIIPILGTIVLIYVLCQPSIYKTEVYHKDFYEHDDDLYNKTYVEPKQDIKENDKTNVYENIENELDNSTEQGSKLNQQVSIVNNNLDSQSLEQFADNDSVNNNSNCIDKNDKPYKQTKRSTKSKVSLNPAKKTRLEQIKECQQLLNDGKITKEEYDSRVLKILSR